MGKIKVTTIEELEDKYLGKIGTPERNAYEAEVSAAILNYHIGEAVKAARKERNMTQDQLAELMGVKKVQVSRIERRCNTTINIISRAFKALGISASLKCGNIQISLS